MSSADSVKDFVLQIEKTLAARRLYHPGNAAYQDASQRLLERCRAAAEGDSFTVRFTSTDLFLDKVSILNRPRHEDSFFFPLFRDGLRELTFTADISGRDLDAFLEVLETKERALASDDIVNLLWRRELTSIVHKAIDGIGDSEDDGEAGNELHGLIADLADKIRNPAAPVTGQTYAFVVDAEVKVGQTDMHYDATTLRRTFEENPTVLRLAEAETQQIRGELGDDRDQTLVERFIEILLVIVRSPAKTIEPSAIAPVFQQIAEGYWTVRDYTRVTAILSHLHSAATQAPNPEYRAALADVIRRFLSVERLNILFLDFVGGALPPQTAFRIWDLVSDDVIWPILLDAFARLPEGETRALVLTALRRRMAANSELLRQGLASPEPARVRASMALLDEKIERLFATDLIQLASHREESIRLKGLAAAARLGGPAALEALWKAMESDPSKSVRLYAFRAMSTVSWPALATRLKALVTEEHFATRPLWERQKYVRLLGEIGGADVAPLFESWIPSKRWLWQAKDLEMLELALCGLGSTGEAGFERVRVIAEERGKPAEVAKKVLESISHVEVAAEHR
ncbi:MAG TPA: HEAT repeat domain-containing protein [Thermoanaerobaculia bacterium]|nr:HEAT repeat domain-containing protein [Thermoanaerobaculia bacterium]